MVPRPRRVGVRSGPGSGRPSIRRSATPVLDGGLPLLGVLPALARDALAVFARARSLGDVVRLSLPGRHPVFVLADPAGIRYVLEEQS